MVWMNGIENIRYEYSMIGDIDGDVVWYARSIATSDKI